MYEPGDKVQVKVFVSPYSQGWRKGTIVAHTGCYPDGWYEVRLARSRRVVRVARVYAHDLILKRS